MKSQNKISSAIFSVVFSGLSISQTNAWAAKSITGTVLKQRTDSFQCQSGADQPVCKKILGFKSKIEKLTAAQKASEAIQGTSLESTRLSEKEARKNFISAFQKTQSASCEDHPDYYLPLKYDPVKVVQVQAIYPQRKNPHPVSGFELEPSNFSTLHDGAGNKSFTAYDHAKSITDSVNHRMQNNQPMAWNGTKPIPPVFPTQIQFKQIGVKFPEFTKSDPNFYYLTGGHNRSQILKSAYHPNAINWTFTSQKNFEWTPGWPERDAQGAIKKDAAGNFVPAVYPHFPLDLGGYINSMLAPSPAVNELKNVWLAHHAYQRFWADQNSPDGAFYGPIGDWAYASGMIYDFGNLVGLAPTHQAQPNLVKESSTSTPTAVSCSDYTQEDDGTWCGKNNNVLDNNCNNSAWTPCQLKIAHYNLSHSMKYLRYIPCSADPKYKTVIPKNETAIWTTAHDLVGDLVVESGATLIVMCGGTLASNAKIVNQGGIIVGAEKLNRRLACAAEGPGPTSPGF